MTHRGRHDRRAVATAGMAGLLAVLCLLPGGGAAAAPPVAVASAPAPGPAALPAWSIQVLSPADGSPATAGARMVVRAAVAGPFLGGEMPQPVAALLHDGSPIASQVVGSDGSLVFRSVPVRAGPYAIRIGPSPGVVTSDAFSVSVRPFGITGGRSSGDRLVLDIATGNFSRGTAIAVTRQGRQAATVRVARRGAPVRVALPDRPGVYQVVVRTPAGPVLGRPPLVWRADAGADRR